MKHAFKILILSLILVSSFYTIVYTQTEERKFDVSGQVRLRGENDAKDFNKETDPIDFSLLRTRLNLKFNYSDKLTAFAQLQDSRTFGEEDRDGEKGTLTSIRNVDLHQGYIQINRLFAPWLSYKFGRMELSYGAQRLIGVNQWSNTGRAFDGSVFTMSFQKVQVDFIAATLFESRQAPDTVDGDQRLNGVWMKFNSPKSHKLNLYVLMDEDQQQNSAGDSQFNRTTAGTRIESELNHFELEAEANVQVGKTNFTQDIFAYYLIGSASYNFDPDKKSQVSIGMDYLSGDKPGTDKYECFNTLYRANHKFFGFMDYFTDIPKHTKNLGLTDIMAKAKITPWEKISLSGDFHLFQLSQSATLNNGSSSKELGSEIDLIFSYNYLKMVNFTLGSSVFMPGKVYKEWKGKDPAWWFYAQTTVNL